MVQCQICDLVQLAPMPKAADIAQLYHEDFDHFAPYIEQLSVHRAYFRQKMKEILAMVKASPRKKLTLLDIGCAMGVLLREAKRVGVAATGVDISKDAVRYCKSQKLAAIAGTIQTLKRTMKDGSYSIVTAFQVIEHERDPKQFVRRIYDLLGDDGLVVVATPNYAGLWRRGMGKRWFGFAHPEHVVLFTPKSMRYLFEEAGFRDIRIVRDTPRPFPLSFALTRAADYFPFLSWLLRPAGKLMDRFAIKNPMNPWDDMILFARKYDRHLPLKKMHS